MKINSIKIPFFFAIFAGMFAILLASCSAAKPSNESSASAQKNRVANVAVVETEMDTRSGAAKDLNAAELSEITAELRRQAVKNLPKNKYNVMTSTTVQAQGTAVLEDCAEENCIITLGSKIGADFIVRGTISKFQKRFTLSVEIYDTEDGNLIVSSDPIRSESIDKLLDASAIICADMYKTFMETYSSVSTSKPATKEVSKKKDDNLKEEMEQTSIWCRTFLTAKDKESFSVAERCKTYYLNIVPGLGSIAVMGDWLGAAAQWALFGGGVVLIYKDMSKGIEKMDQDPNYSYSPGAGYWGGFAVLMGWIFFDAYRSNTYVDPKYRTTLGKNDGFNFAVLPNRHGEWMPYIGYSIEF